MNFKLNKIVNTSNIKIEGTVENTKVDGDKWTFILNAKDKVKCTYYIKSMEEKEIVGKIKIGETIKIEGTKEKASNNTIDNTFNYNKYLKSINVSYLINVSNYKISNKKISLYYKIKNNIYTYLNSFKSKSYMKLLILGNKDEIDGDIYSNYQNAGVTHLFAISGMHVSLLSVVILKLFKKFKFKYFIAIVFLLLYILLLGPLPSIIRSVFLFMLLYLNKKYDFNINSKYVLLLCISIMLFVFPRFIYNVGFIYSSVISYSLINFNYLIKGSYIKKLITISFISFLFSLPITINTNYEINVLSIINNLFFVPFISFVFYPLCLLTLIFPFLDNILFILIGIMEKISNVVFVLKITIPKLPIIIVILYYFFLMLSLKVFKLRYMSISFLLIFLIKFYIIFNPNLYIYYFDVGQGDSIMIRYKTDIYLIDTGGKLNTQKDEWKKREEYDLSKSIILYIKSLGINHIKKIILSHGDYDHMGEAINLAENFKVENVIFNCGEYNDLEKELISVLDKKNIKYYSCIKELNIDKYKLQFLNTGVYDNENDNSSVIYLNYNNYKFLFMGDAGVEREKDILKKYNLSDIDFLKVGHHGSNTSSSVEFINSINPKYSLISVGKNNRYGHPKESVLEMLNNSKIYRTDIDGSVEIKLKKKGYEISTCPP